MSTISPTPPVRRRRRLPLPAPATFVAIIAIVLACAGSATAGVLITGASVQDGTLGSADLRDGSVSRLDLAPAARVPSVVVRRVSDLGVGPVEARCRAGERATGGGGSAMGMWRSTPVTDDAGAPVGWVVQGRYPDGWTGTHTDPDGATWVEDPAAEAYVICARA